MRLHPAAICVGLACCVTATMAHAQNPDPTDIRGCTAIESDAQRLVCYDHATGRVNLPAAQKRQVQATPSTTLFGHEHSGTSATETTGNNDVATPLSLLDTRWELSPESKLGTFNVRGYKPVYVLPLFASSNQNNRPHSPNPDNTVSTTEKSQNAELKFQLSVKAKVWQGVFGDVGDVWVGYTQSSRWQVYNTKQSRPF
ncbi:MAG: phospholipase A, partial [Rhodanobacter sp.]